MNKVLTKKDITKELEISRHQKTVFISGTPLGTLYTEFTQTWDMSCEPFAASIFYNPRRTSQEKEIEIHYINFNQWRAWKQALFLYTKKEVISRCFKK